MIMSRKLKNDCKLDKGIFGLEITITDSCNLRCKYCFEREKTHEKSKALNTDILISKIREFMNSSFFKQYYSGIKIILWGGEPTLAIKIIHGLVNEFKNDKRVGFFIYTNGTRINLLLNILYLCKGKTFIKKKIPKFQVQVSYDGYPVHDRNRKTVNNEDSSPYVMEGIELLYENDIDFGLKSTLQWSEFRFLPSIWNDFKLLYDEFGKNISYNLTVDYYNIDFYKYKNTVENCLIQIAANEIKFFIKNKRFLSNIFRNAKPLCSAGKNMITLDTKGDFYYCHGCLYSSKKEELKFTSIFDKNFINKIEEAYNFFDTNYEPAECKECMACTCLRCNVQKYERSNRLMKFDRWYDFSVQKELCDYYRLVSKIGIAMRTKLRKIMEDKKHGLRM